jgi:hypothetical protein
MEKQEIRNLILLVQKYNGYLTLSYLPQREIETPERCQGLYYGGWAKMEIGNSYRNFAGGVDIDKLNSETIDKAVDDIYNSLNGCIGKEIGQALTNLELDYEDLKYFDRDPELYKKFKKEVSRLKRKSKEEQICDECGAFYKNGCSYYTSHKINECPKQF